MKVDALVLGSGPSGASTAYWLAKGGARVLIVEAHPLPRTKLCSGVLSGWSGREVMSILDPSELEAATLGWLTHTRVETRDGDNFVVPHHPIRLVDRASFDHALVVRAVSHGARLEDGTRAIATHRQGGKWEVTLAHGGKTRRVEADIMVDACGAESPFAALVRGPVQGQVALAVEAKGVPLPAGNPLTMGRIDMSLPGGYFWLFPHSDGTCGVGGGTTDRRLWPSFPHLVRHYWRNRGVDMPDRMPGHRLRYLRLGTVARDGILLVGEAAGSVEPALGEGIRGALVTGRLAARAILSGGDACLRYRSAYALQVRQWLWRREVGAWMAGRIPLPRTMTWPWVGPQVVKHFLGPNVYHGVRRVGESKNHPMGRLA